MGHSIIFLAHVILGDPFRDLETHHLHVGAALLLVALHHLSHFAGVAPAQEVHMHHDPVHEQDQAAAEQHGEVGFASGPRDVDSALDVLRKVEVADPHVGDIDCDGEKGD